MESNDSPKSRLVRGDPLEQLFQWLPKKTSGFRRVKVNLTCFDAGRDVLAIGSDVGVVYLYETKAKRLGELPSTGMFRRHAITCVKIYEPLNHLALGTSSGLVILYRYCLKPGQRMQQFSRDDHKAGVVAMTWHNAGRFLITGDESGKVYISSIDFHTERCQSRVFYEADCPLVQLSSGAGPWALISTAKKSYFVSSETHLNRVPIPIGSKERKPGLYGACFCGNSGAAAVSYVARPGFGLWKTDMRGKVLCTLKYKELLSRDDVPLIDLGDLKIQDDGNGDLRFGILHVFNEQYVVTHCESALWILDPMKNTVLGHHTGIGRIVAVTATETDIYVLREDEDVPIICIRLFGPVSTASTLKSKSDDSATVDQQSEEKESKEKESKEKELKEEEPKEKEPKEEDSKADETDEKDHRVDEVKEVKEEVAVDGDCVEAERRAGETTLSDDDRVGKGNADETVVESLKTEKVIRVAPLSIVSEPSLDSVEKHIANRERFQKIANSPFPDGDIVSFPVARKMTLDGKKKKKKKKKKTQPNDVRPREDSTASTLDDKLAEDRDTETTTSPCDTPFVHSLSRQTSPAVEDRTDVDVSKDAVPDEQNVPEVVLPTISLSSLKPLPLPPEIPLEELEANKDLPSVSLEHSRSPTPTPTTTTTTTTTTVNVVEVTDQDEEPPIIGKTRSGAFLQPEEDDDDDDVDSKRKSPSPRSSSPLLAASIYDQYTVEDSMIASAAVAAAAAVDRHEENESPNSKERSMSNSDELSISVSKSLGSSSSPRHPSFNAASTEDGRLMDNWSLFTCPSRYHLQGFALSKKFVYVVDTKNRVFVSSLFQSKSGAWERVDGYAKQVSVSPTNNVLMGVTTKNHLYYRLGVSPSSPTGLKWEKFDDDIAWVSVEDRHVWAVRSDGTVVFGRLIPSMKMVQFKDVRSMTAERLAFVQVSASKGVVWARDRRGKVYCRAGISGGSGTAINYEGTYWKPVNGDLTAQYVCVGGVNSGWAIANDGAVVFKLGVTIDDPAGKREWWEIGLSGYHVEDASLLTSIMSLIKSPTDTTLKLVAADGDAGVCVMTGSSSVHLSRSGLLGTRYDVVNPLRVALPSAASKWALIAVGGLSSTKDFIWAVRQNGEMFCFPVNDGDDGHAVSIEPPTVGEKIRQIVFCRHSVWVVTDTRAYVRLGINNYCPEGVSWKRADTNTMRSAKIRRLSCGETGIWAIDQVGRAWLRLGTGPAQQAHSSPAWLEIDGSLKLGSPLLEIAVSENDTLVWAYDTRGNVYVRQGVKGSLMTGVSWENVPGAQVREIAVSNECVWAISVNGDLLCRFGISPTNLAGDYWRRCCGSLTQISVTSTNQLWGLDKDGQLLKRRTEIYGIQPSTEETTELLEDYDIL